MKAWDSHSPPAPTPAIPRATISIQNIPVGDAPFAAADSTMPTTRRTVVATAPVLRPSWSTMTPKPTIPLPLVNHLLRVQKKNGTDRIMPMRKALLRRL